ncbi:mandelate racemase/muconate lactonizing enzyme family protein [Pedococcus sp. 5OH_020]|uniref:mandelate racemase/muconate lactonizing enzyme family protein n=1 Tax=Pedococcus sp. 5OH_020 TaxID=2989814 RepID=UPI0022E9E94C|nr:mandelate racemase/muconate lactonizing enzyme family protein [Pedococcus sp. 5OH_020]
MKIESIETMTTRLPILTGEWRDTIHHVTHIELVVVDVTSDTGVTGTGVSHTSGSGAKTIEAMILELADFLVGKEVHPKGLWHEAWHFLHDLGGAGLTTTALGAVDTAHWDLAAKAAGKPLVDVLGRTRDRIPVYASGINLGLSTEELVEQAQRWRANGYRGFKVKVGKPDIAEDVERLTKVREVIGPMPLMVDANQGWGPELAPRRINGLRGLDLTWVEEPLVSDDVSAHARLRTQVETPIGVGENIYNIFQFRDYLVSGAVDFVQADVVRVGGITPWVEIAALAQAFNRPMAPHFMMELSSQVLCAVPNGWIAEDVEGGSLSALKALRSPHRVVDGYYTPGEAPGHGFDFDREYMEQHRT